MANIEGDIKVERARFGLLDGEITEFCKISTEDHACQGISCPMYQNCWENLHPDEQGYFPWKGETYSKPSN